MSGVDDLSLEPVYLTTASQDDVYLSVHNYATLGISVGGTISSGNLTVEGTTDGSEWEELPVAKSNVQLTDNEIISSGTYIIGVAGYTRARIVPNLFEGSVRITPNVSKRITPAFALPIA